MPETSILGAQAVGSDSLFCCATRSQQLSAQQQTRSPKAIGQKAKVADANKAFGQHVQKEAAQELRRCQSHRALLAAAGIILPAESDVFLIEGQQAVIGNGHAMGVAT